MSRGGGVRIAALVPGSLRPHVEGMGEAGMGVAAALGAPVAGVLLALAGLPAVWLAGAVVAVVALRVAGGDRSAHRV